MASCEYPILLQETKCCSLEDPFLLVDKASVKEQKQKQPRALHLSQMKMMVMMMMLMKMKMMMKTISCLR